VHSPNLCRQSGLSQRQRNSQPVVSLAAKIGLPAWADMEKDAAFFAEVSRYQFAAGTESSGLSDLEIELIQLGITPLDIGAVAKTINLAVFTDAFDHLVNHAGFLPTHTFTPMLQAGLDRGQITNLPYPFVWPLGHNPGAFL